MSYKIFDASVAATTIDFFASKSQLVENDVNGNAIYVGYAKPGSDSSEAVWAIKKQTYDANNAITSVKWCESKPVAFSFVWDDRALYNFG